MSVKWFDPRKKAEKDLVPAVTFGKYHMRLNKLTVAMFKTKPEYVLIGYDEDAKTIAVKPCGEDETQRLKVSYNEKQGVGFNSSTWFYYCL